MVHAFNDTRPLRPAPMPAPSGARVPPHDIEAEESLLGAMLLSNDAASLGIELCSRGDFYKPAPFAAAPDHLWELFSRIQLDF